MAPERFSHRDTGAHRGYRLEETPPYQRVMALSGSLPAALVLLALWGCSGQAQDPLDAGQAGAAASEPAQCTGLPEYYTSKCDCNAGAPDCFLLPGVQACGTRVAPDAISCPEGLSELPLYECACGGTTCPTGQHCRTIREAVSGGYYEQNVCFDTCQTDADCSPTEVCWPNRFGVSVCITPECRSDADCSEDDCGHCVQGQWQGFQAAYWKGEPRCVYEGVRSAGSCRGNNIMPMDRSFYYYSGVAHTCHPWNGGS